MTGDFGNAENGPSFDVVVWNAQAAVEGLDQKERHEQLGTDRIIMIEKVAENRVHPY